MGRDADTFDGLVREHLDACLRFAVKLTGSVDSAEEVVQDAMLRASGGWKTFRGDSSFRTWIFRIVIHAWRDRRGTHGGMEDIHDSQDNRSIDPSDHAAAGEMTEAIALAVSTLPPRQREVIVLIVYEQMDISQTAKALGVTEQNVRTNLHYGRQRLKEKLKPYLTQEPTRDRQ